MTSEKSGPRTTILLVTTRLIRNQNPLNTGIQSLSTDGGTRSQRVSTLRPFPHLKIKITKNRDRRYRQGIKGFCEGGRQISKRGFLLIPSHPMFVLKNRKDVTDDKRRGTKHVTPKMVSVKKHTRTRRPPRVPFSDKTHV